ncbi:Receptor-like serine/threonine-protein kinase SD1-8 [Linum grandiflorum]
MFVFVCYMKLDVVTWQVISFSAMATHLWLSLPPIIFICLLSLKPHLCLGADRITQNQSLSGDQTLVSAGSKFELGFFKPGNSSNYYLGIWYYGVSDRTVVWVANRESPIFDHSSTVLRISGGSLVLLSRFQIPIWSTTASASSASVEAVLLDNGNLVLRSAASSDEILWQSFDYPTETFLPGAKLGRNKITGKYTNLVSWKGIDDPAPGSFSLQIDPNGTNSFVIIWQMSSLYWTSGPWNGRIFSLVPEMTLNYIFNFSFVDNENETYFTYSLYNQSILSRLVMSGGGNIQQLTWLASSQQWNLFWSQPRMQCDVQGYCGAFGSCDDRSRPFCHCLEGFVPRSTDAYGSNVFNGGCVRKSNLHCGNASIGMRSTDKFLPGYVVKDTRSGSRANESASNAQECELICLNRCSCTAYAYEGSRCSTWSGDVFDLYKLDYVPVGVQIYVRVAAEIQNSGTKRKVLGAVFGCLAALVLVGFVLFAVLRYRRHKLGKDVEERYNIVNGDEENNTKLTFLSIKSVLAATDNFSELNKLGEEVAIKRLSTKSGQGLEEFMNELKLIAKLQHTYLVRLLGCCVEKDEKILIYEYLPNRSLDKFLFTSYGKAKLDWLTRIKIIEGIAQGLLYIHKYSRLKVIHRDMKASNVLLDAEMNPKISDFGMARIFGIGQAEANTSRIVGTYGYMSPEYAFYGQFSEKSDVFSYGVLLLEIVSGRRNTDFYDSETPFSLLCWAWELWKEGKPEDLLDPALKNSCNNAAEAVKFVHVGLLCVQEAPADRPTMASVAQMLSSNDSQSFPLPGEPAYITRRAVVGTGGQVPAVFSNNQLTFSLPTGR